MMEELPRFVADALVLVALAMLTLAVFGLWRVDGLYNRLHVSGVLLWLGVMPLLLALLTRGSAGAAATAGLLALSLMLTAPVSSHVLARACLMQQHDPEEDANPEAG